MSWPGAAEWVMFAAVILAVGVVVLMFYGLEWVITSVKED